MNEPKLPRHQFWGAGEPDCPPELKVPNGELHTMRCKVCGDGWRKSNNVCLAALSVPACAWPHCECPGLPDKPKPGECQHKTGAFGVGAVVSQTPPPLGTDGGTPQ